MKTPALAAACLILLAGCSSSPKAGTLRVFIVNDGDDMVSEAVVTHGASTLSANYLSPGTSSGSVFIVEPDEPVTIRYTDGLGRQREKSYQLRMRPIDTGTLQLRVNRDGEVAAQSQVQLARGR